MKRILLLALAATALTACGQSTPQQEPISIHIKPTSVEVKQKPRADETNDADHVHEADEKPLQERSPYIRCASHTTIRRDMLMDGMTLDSYEGGGTGTSSIVEVYTDGARKQLRVAHGPDRDCIIDPALADDSE